MAPRERGLLSVDDIASLIPASGLTLMNETNVTVIARLDRATQYAAASRLLSGVSGILDPRFRGDDKHGCNDV